MADKLMQTDRKVIMKGPVPSTTRKGTTDVMERLKAFDSREPLAVLATNDDGKPYTSLISFALTPDLGQVVFATPKKTRKFKNIMNSKDVALLIDNRSDRRKGFMETEAITVLGDATALRRSRAWLEYAGILLKKHPGLEEFINASTTALVIIDIKRCVHVGRFQTVTDMVWKDREG